ncbi:hypothetical protein RI129_006363 [Pyrocoelia pectoralis]|uniref:Transcription cofactor vestigial-like protein 4 n=1 Tax=Pyrocoelia pectoralis TaxID=417401 RepID=A0AAN7VGT6_9COLE
MDIGESPLDVLSRVAEIQQAITISEDSNKHTSTKQLPTTKWKRDRRTRSEYSRKSDPKIPDEFEIQNGNTAMDTPLDMSVRQRGQPPSYSQTINNPEFRSNYRTSVITQTQRDDIPSGISMCDPIIDEHFRRSLGKDYVKIFSNNNVPPKDPIVKTAPKINDKVMELMDSTGLSVDDHFAKALGDTWLKLNKKEDIECDSSEKEAVISV